MYNINDPLVVQAFNSLLKNPHNRNEEWDAIIPISKLSDSDKLNAQTIINGAINSVNNDILRQQLRSIDAIGFPFRNVITLNTAHDDLDLLFYVEHVGDIIRIR